MCHLNRSALYGELLEEQVASQDTLPFQPILRSGGAWPLTRNHMPGLSCILGSMPPLTGLVSASVGFLMIVFEQRMNPANQLAG